MIGAFTMWWLSIDKGSGSKEFTTCCEVEDMVASGKTLDDGNLTDLVSCNFAGLVIITLAGLVSGNLSGLVISNLAGLVNGNIAGLVSGNIAALVR